MPAIDEAALRGGALADRLLAAARVAGNERWATYLAPLPDRLRDDEPRRAAPHGDAGAGRLRPEGLDPRRPARPSSPSRSSRPIDRLLRVLRPARRRR